jgi:hypothetical protein
MLVVSMLTLACVSRAEVCRYGLYTPTTADCLNVERQALKRVASAKTICFSANSQVEWSKNNKQPVGAFATMRAGARIAMKGFTPLYTCERADLVVKIDYDAVSPEAVTLIVTDAESGDSVFREQRSVSDLSSDITRMATHFQSMRSDALADEVATAAEIQAKAKRKAFFEHLPRRWRNVEGLVVDVWVTGDVLNEASTQMIGDVIKLETHCAVKQGADEVTPWTGYCNYNFSWSNWSRPSCTVQAEEAVTTISAQEIGGRSQQLDSSPLHRNPPSCPVLSSESRAFSLTPDKDQASK